MILILTTSHLHKASFYELAFMLSEIIQFYQNTIRRQLELIRLVPDADQTTIRVGQEYDQKTAVIHHLNYSNE